MSRRTWTKAVMALSFFEGEAGAYATQPDPDWPDTTPSVTRVRAWAPCVGAARTRVRFRPVRALGSGSWLMCARC